MDTQNTKRLFVAVAVAPQIKEQLSVLPRDQIGGRWTHPDDLHITLRFLGDVSSEKAEVIKEILLKVKRAPFTIEASGMDMFYNKSQTILYADVVSTKKLTALCTDITDLLVPMGFDFGTRPYTPHVTLARLKKNEKAAEQYKKHHGSKIRSQWQVDAFYLMESGLPDEKGTRYHEVCRYGLTP